MPRRRPRSLAVALLAGASLLLLLAAPGAADEAYRQPPADVLKILKTPPPPALALSPSGAHALLIERTSYPPVSDLAQPLWRLGGHRLNPRTNGPHRARAYVGLSLMTIADGSVKKIAGLPEDDHIDPPAWSPDGARFAFTRTVDTGIELWVGSVREARVRRLTEAHVNAAVGPAFTWLPDGERILYRAVPEGRGPAPEEPTVPPGPVIQETEGGTKAPIRTYQDLLADAHDEARLDWIATSQLVLIEVDGAEKRKLGAPAIHTGFSPAPGGDLLLVERIERPYSYLVPTYRFPEVVEVRDLQGELVHEVARRPLRDAIPIGGVETGPRGFRWRASRPATLLWVEALDGGDPKREAKHRDELFSLSAPFEGEPRAVCKLEHRYSGLSELEDGARALLSEYDRDRRWRRTWLYTLDEPGEKPRLVWDRSVNDHYGDPGNPVTRTNEAGYPVVRMNGETIFLAGRGATPEGDRPFLDALDLSALATKRLFECRGESFETVSEVLSDDASLLLTRHETQTEPPNYFVRDLAKSERRRLTEFPDPAPQLAGIQKELVVYERDDGVKLSATLYLPPGHQEGQRLPLVVWAYPREYNDPSTAGQVSGSPYRFTRPSGTSHLFFLTQGYAIMDAATMPVVGDPETMNDTFIAQIVASAKAAIDEAVRRGVADPERVGVGGHSYGAFMTANLLAHCDLFRAGIARSGAYNRTLTPFGFQSERRTFWEAPRTYFEVSPFMHAHKVNEPILLVHGEIDNNSGTFPLQSQRMFHAIKGNGGRARLVMLPHESHGYRGRESVQHVLAEMIDWFDTHVKNAPPRAESRPEGRREAH